MIDCSVIFIGINCKNNFEKCIKNFRKGNPVKELIYVDSSDDDTADVAKQYFDKVVVTRRIGVGTARNAGLDVATGKYICYVGIDNIMEDNSIANMIAYLLEKDCTAVSLKTLIYTPKDYLGKALNIYRNKFTEGYKDALGTPILYRAEILKKYRFKNMVYNDDGDLFDRMIKDGNKFAISKEICYEFSTTSWKETITRWRRYGLGDCEFYYHNLSHAGIPRKLRSFMHPFMTDIIKVFFANNIFKFLYALPFLSLVTVNRYIGWAKAAKTVKEMIANHHSLDMGEREKTVKKLLSH
jgi:glycosyltransferase involved in cell wall biosynthesis